MGGRGQLWVGEGGRSRPLWGGKGGGPGPGWARPEGPRWGGGKTPTNGSSSWRQAEKYSPPPPRPRRGSLSHTHGARPGLPPLPQQAPSPAAARLPPSAPGPYLIATFPSEWAQLFAQPLSFYGQTTLPGRGFFFFFFRELVGSLWAQELPPPFHFCCLFPRPGEAGWGSRPCGGWGAQPRHLQPRGAAFPPQPRPLRWVSSLVSAKKLLSVALGLVSSERGVSGRPRQEGRSPLAKSLDLGLIYGGGSWGLGWVFAVPQKGGSRLCVWMRWVFFPAGRNGGELKAPVWLGRRGRGRGCCRVLLGTSSLLCAYGWARHLRSLFPDVLEREESGALCAWNLFNLWVSAFLGVPWETEGASACKVVELLNVLNMFA